jgi:nucleotide-binding universal stress UspA family protein
MAAIVTRILVPVDFGPASELALRYAKRLAARCGASITALHVVEITATEWCGEPLTTGFPNAVDRMRQDADFRLGILLTPAERVKLNVSAEVVVGNPARQIIAYARTHDIDLIVMGTHGRCGFAHAMLGSVAERTIRSAPCPVLTVRALTTPLEPARAGSEGAIFAQ